MWVGSLIVAIHLFHFQVEESSWGDLTHLTLEELANIEVITASHAPIAHLELPQALFVINSQDLENRGISHIAEALRLVPGIHVARNTSSSWVTGLRGFSENLSRAILVLVDGRSVYNHLFAGVYWADLDFPIDIIERIEVILGPGGNVWGANAVHGVINIITKPASKTQSGFLSSSGGSVEPFRSILRYGGTLGKGHFRIWGQYQEEDGAVHDDGTDFDTWNSRKFGFRTDQDLGFSNLCIQAGYLGSNLGERSAVPDSTGTQTVSSISRTQVAGHFLLANLKARVGDFQWKTKAYYQYSQREAEVFYQESKTLDLETVVINENRWGTTSFGAKARSITDHTRPSQSVAMDPNDEDLWVKGIFLEHQSWFLDKKLMVLAGGKIEDSTYADWEWQPRVGMSLFPLPHFMLWASASRAIRAPSRVERDITIYALTEEDRLLVRLQGNDMFRSEVMNALEFGSRFTLKEQSIGISLFQQSYDHLVSTEVGQLTTATTPYGVRPILPIHTGNGINATSMGGEIQWSYWPEGLGKFSFRYAYHDLDVTVDPDSTDLSGRRIEGASPKNQFQIDSLIPFNLWLKMQATVRWVDALSTREIPAYWDADASLHCQLGQGMRLGLYGRNLFHDEHAEFTPEIRHQRQIAAELQWQW